MRDGVRGCRLLDGNFDADANSDTNAGAVADANACTDSNTHAADTGQN
jgi:hypothetical protein